MIPQTDFTRTYVRGVVCDIYGMLQNTTTKEDVEAIAKRIEAHLANLNENLPSQFHKTEPMIPVDEPEFDILDDTTDEESIINDYFEFDDDDILDILS